MEKLTRVVKEKFNGTKNSFSPTLCSSCAIVPKQGPRSCTRVDPPIHYIYKIRSYQLVSKYEKHISPAFEEGGTKWNLCFYPNGKKDEGGEGYISIYLMVADADSLPRDWVVKAFFRLLLLDRVSGKYLMLGDTHERCFHAMNKEQGFARFIRLKTFLNPLRGYLIGDACEIGAEVFVVRNTGRGDSFERIRGTITYTHTWTIQNFSKQELAYYRSRAFNVGGHEWKIKIYPKGMMETNNSLSLFILLVSSSNLGPGQQVYVDYKLSIKSQAGNDICFRGQCWFSAKSRISGCQKFISLDELKDPEKGYLVEDRCKIKAEISVLGLSITMV